VKKQADCSVGRETEYERINFCPEAMFLEHNIVTIESGVNVSATLRTCNNELDMVRTVNLASHDVCSKICLGH
jgi:hypothetical protein